MMAVASRLSRMPPCWKEVKNDGPTCKPMQKTKSIKPKSRMKCRMSVLPVKPKWPMRMPMNSTKVTPNDTP